MFCGQEGGFMLITRDHLFSHKMLWHSRGKSLRLAQWGLYRPACIGPSTGWARQCNCTECRKLAEQISCGLTPTHVEKSSMSVLNKIDNCVQKFKKSAAVFICDALICSTPQLHICKNIFKKNKIKCSLCMGHLEQLNMDPTLSVTHGVPLPIL